MHPFCSLSSLLVVHCYVSVDKIIVPDIVFEEESQPAAGGQGAKFDCLFRYDKTLDENLVVKWYYEDDPEPIYQWIPELGKQFVSGKFRPHILISAGSSASASQNGASGTGRPSAVLQASSSNGPNYYQNSPTTIGGHDGSSGAHQQLTRAPTGGGGNSQPGNQHENKRREQAEGAQSQSFGGFTLTRPSKELSGE